MNKVILKTTLVTIAGLALAALLVFSLWILISPQTMATSCEKTGNYTFAVTCADLRYKYTGKTQDLARCAQDSISARKDKLIVKYCEKLVADEGFDELCKVKDESLANTEFGEYVSGYKIYVYGNLSAAQYRTDNLEGAIISAQSGGSFSKLVIEVIDKKDYQSAQKVLEALENSDENLYKLLEEFITKGV